MCSDCFLCLIGQRTFFIFKILRITAHARDGTRPSLVHIILVRKDDATRLRSKWSFVSVVGSWHLPVPPCRQKHRTAHCAGRGRRRCITIPYPAASGRLHLLAAAGRRGPIGWTAGGFYSMCYVSVRCSLIDVCQSVCAYVQAGRYY